MRRLLRQAALIPILLGLLGLHARRPRTDVDVDVDTSRSDSDTDTRRVRSPLPGRSHTADAAETRTRITAARPKRPGPPAQHPHRRKRKLPDGTVLEIPKKGTPERPKQTPEYSSGFTEGLDAPTQNEDGSWNINLRKHEDWDQADFDAKANYLKELGENDQLSKKTGDGDERGSTVDQWRRDKEYEILHTSETQAEVNQRLQELDRQQIDHAHELQLGGRDTQDNMWGIESVTNHGMGGQINSQLRQVPDGARVRINIVE
ncbi:hypothetical protein [Glycomyces albidus]|uniref:Uncharacterized protein n=1 Tax=Glycomyces albidus TaxID=2656774 RepID=A0A6L5GF58_9ACTN|nr:hypothetical protein [Glycomyces albidus]MQM28236.1 hypothetical protein [Glycomyces albidus]